MSDLAVLGWGIIIGCFLRGLSIKTSVSNAETIGEERLKSAIKLNQTRLFCGDGVVVEHVMKLTSVPGGDVHVMLTAATEEAA